MTLTTALPEGFPSEIEIAEKHRITNDMLREKLPKILSSWVTLYPVSPSGHRGFVRFWAKVPLLDQIITKDLITSIKTYLVAEIELGQQRDMYKRLTVGRKETLIDIWEGLRQSPVLKDKLVSEYCEYAAQLALYEQAADLATQVLNFLESVLKSRSHDELLSLMFALRVNPVDDPELWQSFVNVYKTPGAIEAWELVMSHPAMGLPSE